MIYISRALQPTKSINVTFHAKCSITSSGPCHGIPKEIGRMAQNDPYNGNTTIYGKPYGTLENLVFYIVNVY